MGFSRGGWVGDLTLVLNRKCARLNLVVSLDRDRLQLGEAHGEVTVHKRAFGRSNLNPLHFGHWARRGRDRLNLVDVSRGGRNSLNFVDMQRVSNRDRSESIRR